MKEELDDLRRQDAEFRHQVLDLRGELEKEKGLTLAAKEAASALDVKGTQDAAATERLRQERDDSRRTESRLRSERDSSHKDLAGARHQVNSLEGELAQSRSGLSEAREALQKEVVLYDNERLAAGLVC